MTGVVHLAPNRQTRTFLMVTSIENGGGRRRGAELEDIEKRTVKVIISMFNEEATQGVSEGHITYCILWQMIHRQIWFGAVGSSIQTTTIECINCVQ